MVKVRYEIDLPSPPPAAFGSDLVLRRIALADLDALAGLMLDAYRGTTDFEDETYEDAVAEVQSFFDGSPSFEHSYLALDGDEAVSAVLVSVYEGEAFIGYVMTRPGHKGRGLGRHLVRQAMGSLADDGHGRIVLYITEGNTPSERLFAGVDARRIDR